MNSESRFGHYLQRAIYVWRKEGIKSTWQKAILHWQKARLSELLDKEDRSAPEVSIVIPVFNALSMTQECIASIFEETQNIKFELLIIDNASTDGTDQWLKLQQKKHSNIRIFRMDINIGFGPAVNIGLQHSKGEFIVILNNDTLVAPGWLDHLLSAMNTDPFVGIVSPLTNYVGQGAQLDLQAQNLPPDPATIAQYAGRIADRSELIYEPNRLVFFCVLIRSELIDLIGCLDEGYQKGNFEDDDFCLRTRMAGYRLAIAQNAFVYHHGTATFKRNKISHFRWMEINRRRFYRKAGRVATSWQPYTALFSPSHQNKAISVIVRTKDRPQLLKKALTSLANQTLRDLEIVLVNDGGADVSQLAASFEHCFPIVYIQHDAPRGRTAAINTGLEKTHAEWIAVLDDDDIVYPWHFETLWQIAEQSKAGVVYSDYNRALFATFGDLYPIRLIGAQPWEYSRPELEVQNYLPIHTWMYKHEYVEKVGLWDESLDRLEDYDFLLRLSALHDFKHVDKVTCEYRYFLDHANSITEGRDKYLSALEQIYKRYPVDDSNILRNRRVVLEELRDQVRRINVIRKKRVGDHGGKDITNREIIRLVVGL